MFREVGASKALKSSRSDNLSWSGIRLVPKGTTFRPIMNLRRRAMIIRDGKKCFERAINFQLKSVYSVLNYEKLKQPDRLGSSLFSISDLYPKIKAFQVSLLKKMQRVMPLYFAKVDVMASFDSIPQRGILDLINSLCSERAYCIEHHAEVKACDTHGYWQTQSSTLKASRRFLQIAQKIGHGNHFEEKLGATLAKGKNNTVFVDAGVSSVESRVKLFELLREHVQYNKVKIGQKYFYQNQGIPQGSILSSMLCNFFYGQFEMECLGFLGGPECLLLRLIDDFLLITTDRTKAVQFLKTMQTGNETYGIAVRREKSLANFPCSIDGFEIAAPADKSWFPYCGTVINTQTLEIARDRKRQKDSGMLGRNGLVWKS